MLNDRDYMRGEDPRGNYVGGFYALVGLIAVNVIFFIISNLSPEAASEHMMLSGYGIEDGRYYQLLTTLFLHHDFFHLFFNMWGLYIFGSLIAPILGANRFLLVYLLSGLASDVLFLLTSDPAIHCLGASGAVMGISMAAAMMAPDISMFLLFIPFPIKLRTMALVFFGLELFLEMSQGAMDGIAHFAHIGGFIGGYLVMRFMFRRFVQWDPLNFLSGGKKQGTSGRRQSPPPGWTVSDSQYSPPPPPPTGRVTQQELDALLDKISRGGINSLTEAELARLRQAREQMRRQ